MDIARALLDGAVEGSAVWTLLDLLAVIDELFVEADLLKTLYGGPSQSPAAKLNLLASAYGCSTTGSNEVYETFNTSHLPQASPQSKHDGHHLDKCTGMPGPGPVPLALSMCHPSLVCRSASWFELRKDRLVPKRECLNA